MAFEDEIAGQQEATENLANATERVATASGAATNAQNELISAWERAQQAAENHSNTLQKMSNFFFGEGAEGPKRFKQALTDLSDFAPDKLISGLDTFKNLVIDNTGQVNELGISIGSTFLAATNALPETQNAFAELGNSASTAGSTAQESFKNISPVLKEMTGWGEGVAGVLSNVFAVSDRARNLELNLMRNAAAAGDLKAIYDETVPTIEELRDESSAFTEMTYRVAQATGTAQEQVTQYAGQLQRIPGMLREQVNVLGDSAGEMNMLEATMKVASGTHQDFSDVVGQLDEAYRDFNTTGDEALALVSRMAVAAQELQMPMDIVRKTTMGAAEGLKFFGDNTQGVISVLGRMGGALDDVIGPAAVGELTQQITRGIENLDIAHKAFLSEATGGPGGLAGGMEIDLMLQEGNVDEVFNKIQGAMEEHFGEALTLRQARDTGREDELFQQVAYLRQVAGVAGSDAQAYRILEAMQEGQTETFKDAISTPQDALKQTVEQGNTIQERQHTVLTSISNHVARIQQMTAIGALAGVRRTFGTEDGGLATYLMDMMQQQSNIATSRGAAGAGPELSTGYRETANLAITEIFGEGRAAFQGMGSALKDTITEVRGATEASKRAQEEKERNNAEREGTQGNVDNEISLMNALSQYGQGTAPEIVAREGEGQERRRVTSLVDALGAAFQGGERTTAATIRGDVQQALPQGRTQPRENDVPMLLRQMAQTEQEADQARARGEIEEPAVVHLIIEERGAGGKVTVREVDVKKGDSISQNFTGFKED